MAPDEWIQCLDKRPEERNREDITFITSQLKRISPLDRLPSPVLHDLAKCSYYEDLEKGITLYREGDSGTNWYTVITGHLEKMQAKRQHRSTPNGYHVESQGVTLRAGSTFGESVLGQSPRLATVVTRDNCELLRVEQRDFRTIWKRNKDDLEEVLFTSPECNLGNNLCRNEVKDHLNKNKLVNDNYERRKNTGPQLLLREEAEGSCDKKDVMQQEDSKWSPRTALSRLSRKKKTKEITSPSAPSHAPPGLMHRHSDLSLRTVNRNVGLPTKNIPLETGVSKSLQGSPVPVKAKTIKQKLASRKSQTNVFEDFSSLFKTVGRSSPVADRSNSSTAPSSPAQTPGTPTKNAVINKKGACTPTGSPKMAETPVRSPGTPTKSPGTPKAYNSPTVNSADSPKSNRNRSSSVIPGTAAYKDTPPSSPKTATSRRPSLIRASSFDSPVLCQRRASLRSEVLRLRCESQDTTEEEEEEEKKGKAKQGEEESLSKDVESRRRRSSFQEEKSQDLDSPSTAAMPIIEAPSVKVCEAAWVLRNLLLARSPYLMKDRPLHNKTHPKCCIGSELTEWLIGLSPNVHSRTQAAAMWQVLVEEGAMFHVTGEQPFYDKSLYYRFLDEEASSDVPPPQVRRDAEDRLPSVISFLSKRAPDATLRLVLRKPSHERSLEDQELVYEELQHLKALAHLSHTVKRELASVIKFEAHSREGTVIFQQGSEGKSWYIILKGSVNVIIRGKGIVNVLEEGDDFGDLALVNDAPRAATIVLREDNCHFLRVDKGDFNRILRDVEANTVRLKEHGKDVLVLEKISSSAHSHYKYSVMAGTPQKMLEHLLETRLDGRRGSLGLGVGVGVGIGNLPFRRCNTGSTDLFLDDFLLTHIVFMSCEALTQELLKHYRLDSQSGNQDEEFLVACKRRVIHFVHQWAMTIREPVFDDPVVTNFLQTLQEEVAADVSLFGAALRDEAGLMLSVAEALEKYERVCSTVGVSKWKLPTSGRPISVFGAASIEDSLEPHKRIRPRDDIIFRVYCADHTYCTLRFPMSSTAEVIKKSSADKLGLRQQNLLLVELKSSGETVQIGDQEVCAPTGLSLNGRLFVSYKDHLDALTPLAEQEGPKEGTYNQLEMYSTKELAYHITLHDWALFMAIHEYEFLYQVLGRDHFGKIMGNFDVFLRRFNELQYWIPTEICLANAMSKRTQLLRKFIKLAAYCKEHQNLNAFFAIIMGLGNVSVTRMTQTWERLSSRFKKMYTEFEALTDPSRNHRAYRIYFAKLQPPIIPFTPLLMKDMTFTHEGNRTYTDELVNFEKMHMLAQTLRTVRYCRSAPMALDEPPVPRNETEIRPYIRNLQVIDNQKRLMVLSQRVEPKRV